jgi:hypothetical protein
MLPAISPFALPRQTKPQPNAMTAQPFTTASLAGTTSVHFGMALPVNPELKKDLKALVDDKTLGSPYQRTDKTLEMLESIFKAGSSMSLIRLTTKGHIQATDNAFLVSPLVRLTALAHNKTALVGENSLFSLCPTLHAYLSEKDPSELAEAKGALAKAIKAVECSDSEKTLLDYIAEQYTAPKK